MDQVASFFICTRCKKPAIEVPRYEGDKLYHSYCDSISKEIETKKVAVPYDPTRRQASISFLNQDSIVIRHPYNKILNEIYHAYVGFVWNREANGRVIKKNAVNSRSAHFLINRIQEIVSDFAWQKDEDVVSFLKTKDLNQPGNQDKIIKLNEMKGNLDINIDLSHLKIKPFGYQKVGIAFLESTNGIAMVADEMGLGKSLEAIAYASKHGFKTVVVTKASIKYQWESEVAKFTSKKATVLTDKTKDTLSDYDFIITNYDQLKKWADVLKKIKWECAIIDESHEISNVSSQRYKHVRALFGKVPHRITLTGTPLENRTINFYSQLQFLRPDEFRRKDEFGMRYCDPQEGFNGYMEFKGSSNLDELSMRIAPFYIRRLKKDVLPDLPEKLVSSLYFEMEQKDFKEYQSLKTGLFKDKSQSSFAAKGHLTTLQKDCSIKKVPFTSEFIRNFIDENRGNQRKIIVFAHFKEAQQLLISEFQNISVNILGGDSDEKREKARERFNNDPDIKVLIVSTLGGGVGLNLISADTVIFNDLLWTPTDHKQAEDRIHRIGQKNKCFIYYTIFKGSIEESIWKTLERKFNLVSQTLGDVAIEEENTVKDILDAVLLTKMNKK